MKTKYKHVIIAIIGIFTLLAIVSSVSACWVPEIRYDLDNGTKIFKINNKKIHTSWDTYRHSETNNSAIKVNKEYSYKNKKNKIVETGVSYEIEKTKKNRITVKTNYWSGPPVDQVKMYKTKLSVKAFYWKYIETQFTGKLDKKIFSKTSIIDKGKVKATLPYNNPDFKNITKIKHYITWKTKTYSKFSNILYISQKYRDTDPNPRMVISDSYGNSKLWHDPSIILEKTKKNVIKITMRDLSKLNGGSIKDKTYSVKTKMSLKKYYFKVFKPKMVKMFSLKK